MTNDKPLRNTAQWSLTLDAQCDNCRHEFDVLSFGDAGDILHGIAPCQTDMEIDLQCPECEHCFVARTIY